MTSETTKVLHVTIGRMDQEDHTAFYAFMEEHDILPWRTMRSGGGAWDGLFEVKDAHRVEAWLEANEDGKTRLHNLLKEAESRIAFVAGALTVSRDHQQHGESLVGVLSTVKNALESLGGEG